MGVKHLSSIRVKLKVMMRASSVKVRLRQELLPSRLRRLSSMWFVAQTPDGYHSNSATAK